MAKTLSLSGQFASTTAVPNIDSYYGPYQDETDVINKLVGDGTRSKATNGLTVGIFENEKVVDYVFQNIVSGQTPTGENLFKKVNNTKVVLKDTSGQTIGQFTLNQAANGDIEITIPSQVIVDQAYNAVSQNAQSGTAVAGAISGKANTNDVMQRVTGHTNEIPTFTSTGTLQGSGKTMANVVFFDDVN